MEKRSRRRVPDLVARPAFQGLSENEIGRARISMMARNTNVPFKGRIQKRKTKRLQIVKSDLQRTASPYRCARKRLTALQQKGRLFDHLVGGGEQCLRYGEPKSLRRLEVDRKFVF